MGRVSTCSGRTNATNKRKRPSTETRRSKRSHRRVRRTERNGINRTARCIVPCWWHCGFRAGLQRAYGEGDRTNRRARYRRRVRPYRVRSCSDHPRSPSKPGERRLSGRPRRSCSRGYLTGELEFRSRLGHSEDLINDVVDLRNRSVILLCSFEYTSHDCRVLCSTRLFVISVFVAGVPECLIIELRSKRSSYIFGQIFLKARVVVIDSGGSVFLFNVNKAK